MREDKETPDTSRRSGISGKNPSLLDNESEERLARIWENLFEEYERKIEERETPA